MKADLHIHSLYSNDGEIGIPEIIRQCKDEHVDMFTISDHNCVGGSREAAEICAGMDDLHFVPGIEIDCNYKGTDLHLLGFQVDLGGEDFDLLEALNRQRHLDVIPQMVHNLAKLGIEVDLEELMSASGGEPPSAELFAELLLQKPGQESNPSLRPYLPGGKRSDMPLINFYLDFFAQGKPAYVKIRHMGFEEALELVTGNGGIPVIAHPGLNLKGREEVANELIDLGAAGLEVFNNYHNDSQVDYFAELCRERAVLMTCGSDFHGKNKPLISIGHYSSTTGYEHYLELSLSRILGNR